MFLSIALVLINSSVQWKLKVNSLLQRRSPQSNHRHTHTHKTHPHTYVHAHSTQNRSSRCVTWCHQRWRTVSETRKEFSLDFDAEVTGPFWIWPVYSLNLPQQSARLSTAWTLPLTLSKKETWRRKLPWEVIDPHVTWWSPLRNTSADKQCPGRGLSPTDTLRSNLKLSNRKQRVNTPWNSIWAAQLSQSTKLWVGSYCFSLCRAVLPMACF